MQERANPLINNCSFSGVKPIMADLPYPPIQVKERNLMYANMLSVDYCGAVSELSAVTQYINNENRLSCNYCSMAKTLLGIGMAEMMHLQKLGELIFLLGGTVDFTAKYRNGRPRMWTPEYLSIPEDTAHMLMDDIEAEKDAIRQYEAHINSISDECVNAVLKRIIADEEYHIMLLQHLRNEL